MMTGEIRVSVSYGQDIFTFQRGKTGNWFHSSNVVQGDVLKNAGVICDLSYGLQN